MTRHNNIVWTDRISSLLGVVDSLIFIPVDAPTWLTIHHDGIDSEHKSLLRSQWLMASLPLTSEESMLIRMSDTGVLDAFNLFGIELSQKYNNRLIQLIDYDLGVVTIIKAGVDNII